MNGLTPQMAACVAAIRKLTAEGVPPSYDELAAEMGLAAKSNIHRIVRSLHKRGLLEFDPGHQRSLRLVEEDLSPARLERLSSEQLRVGMAHIAGILAHRESRAASARIARRIADAIELKPRVETRR